MGMLKFTPVFLEPAEEFLDQIDPKAKKKLIYQVEKSRKVLDPKVLKKTGRCLVGVSCGTQKDSVSPFGILG